ncbi:MAG: hypothetical protein AB7O62_02885 [Pirellulales bacterium]
MILNAYAVLDLFLCGIRVLLAVALAAVTVQALLKSRKTRSADQEIDQPSGQENRGYLAMLLGMILFGLSLAAWPMLYLLLDSYIPQWPGVMCIYGVTQIGRGTTGVSRFLPGILTTIESLRPLVVFLAGAWLVAYRTARRAETDSPLGRLPDSRQTTFPQPAGVLAKGSLWLLVALACASAVDAGLEAAYVVLPKQTAVRSGGCCTMMNADNRGASGIFTHGDTPAPTWLWVSEGIVLLGMMAGLAAVAYQPVGCIRRGRLWLLCLGAAGTLILTSLFLIDIAAPWLLRLPRHHCLYCLFVEVPESLLAVLALVGGGFAVGWAGVLALVQTRRGWQQNNRDSAMPSDAESTVDEGIRRLLRWGLAGYVSFAIMLPLEMVLAQ